LESAYARALLPPVPPPLYFAKSVFYFRVVTARSINQVSRLHNTFVNTDSNNQSWYVGSSQAQSVQNARQQIQLSWLAFAAGGACSFASSLEGLRPLHVLRRSFLALQATIGAFCPARCPPSRDHRADPAQRRILPVLPVASSIFTDESFHMCVCVCVCACVCVCVRVNPIPSTLHPPPFTLHPSPSTLHPPPYTIHPLPYILHHTPSTIHPTPYALPPYQDSRNEPLPTPTISSDSSLKSRGSGAARCVGAGSEKAQHKITDTPAQCRE